MTKIDIISGFLGAGKTTFIKKMLQEGFKGEQVVLIENEFGEIGIDGGFLKDAGIEIREMNSGCICCSLVGDFGRSLKEVVDTYHPDKILIEPSGVGKLSDVIKAVRDVEVNIDAQLNSFTTVVDATKCRMYKKNFGEFFSNQIEYAGAIILSRTDKAKEEKVKEAYKILRELNEKAPIITTPIAQLSGEKLLETMEHSKTLEDELLSEIHTHVHDHEHEHDENCTCGCHDHDHEHEHHHEHDENCTCGCHDHDHEHEHHHEHEHDENCTCGCHDHDHEHEHHHEHEHDENCTCGCHDHDHEHEHHHEHDENCTCGCHDHHHHHHHADEVFTSWGRETIKSYTRDEITNILETLSKDDSYGVVLRAKGMVQGDNEWIYFDMVPEECEIRDGAADYTGRLCVIGSKLNEEKIAELFGV